MICHHCGRDNPDDEMFCLACGEALRAEPDEPEVVLPEPPQQPVRQEPVEEDYGETEPYFATKAARRRMQREQEYRAQEYYPDRDGGQLPARRRKSRAPFLIVSHLTAFIAALCFWLPFREWVSFHYSLLGFEISDGRLTLSELAKRFYDNRGILSLTVEQYDEVLDVVLDLEPSRIFINIGTNDLSRGGDTIGNLMRRYRAMIHRIKKTLPECEITCLAYYPCLPPDHPEIRPGRISRTMESVRKANLEIEEMCRQENLRFLDLNEPLYDANGDLKEELSLDQIHFSAEGYIRVFDQLKEYLK